MPIRLLKGIQHFKCNHYKEKEEVFTALSKGQAPDVLFFGCIDSRVDLRLVTNANPGEMLVDRNPGNIVTPYSSSPSGEASSIEFALMHLNVGEIIVCGHSHCGAMKGLMTKGIEKDLPSTAAWLSHAKAALEHVHEHYPELNDDPSLKLKCLTQNNILLQIEHLKSHPAVTRRLNEGKLKIHGWYYEFEKGEIYIYNTKKKSFISFEATVDEVAQEKLRQIVKEEALNYLSNLTPVVNKDHYSLLEHFSSINEVAPIWEQIKAQVKVKITGAVGELYLTCDKKFSPKFNELLNKGSSVEVAAATNKYQQIEQQFNQALKYQSSKTLTNEKKNLLSTVTQLKEYSLNQFASSEELFNYNYCMVLAKSTQDLTEKLMNNSAQSSDIDTFKKTTNLIESPDSNSHILTIILTTIAIIASGIVAGFLFGVAPGAVIGRLTGTVSAALAIGIWAQNKNPLQQLIKSAEKLTPYETKGETNLF